MRGYQRPAGERCGSPWPSAAQWKATSMSTASEPVLTCRRQSTISSPRPASATGPKPSATSAGWP